MADYYTQFTTGLSLDSKEEADWLSQLCECFNALVREDYVTDDGDHFHEDGTPATKMGELARDLYKQDEFGCFCEWELNESPRSIVFYSEDNGEPHAVALVVQAFFRHFKKPLTECFCLEWANTCSKMYGDGFGGGALVVNCETIRSMGTGDWIHDQLTKLGAIQEEKKGG